MAAEFGPPPVFEFLEKALSVKLIAVAMTHSGGAYNGSTLSAVKTKEELVDICIDAVVKLIDYAKKRM